MKKIYSLLILSITCTLGFSQAYNGQGNDDLWSNPNNWNNQTIVSEGAIVNIWNLPTNIDVDVTGTYKFLTNLNARTVDFTFTGIGNNTLTIDNGNTNTQWGGQTTAYGIRHQTTAKQTVTINCNITFNNSEAGYTSLRLDGNTENSMIFGENSVLNLIGGGAGVIWSDQNLASREFYFNGEITGTKTFLFGSGSAIFGATSNNPNYTGNMTLTANSHVTVNTENVFLDGTNGNRIQSNGGGTIIFNTANSLTNGVDISVKPNKIVDVQFNANQNGLGQFIFLDGGSGEINLTIGTDVTELQFETQQNQDWKTGTLNIINFKNGVLKFGPNNSGLTEDQLGKIKIDGQTPTEALAIDSDGSLKYASTLSAKTFKTFDFSIYPNPVKTSFTINTQENLKSIELYNVIGKRVLSQTGENKMVTTSSLSNGVYILKLASERGISTKKIVVE